MPIFETTGSSDPLGLWTSAPAPETVHFGIDEGTSPPEPSVPVFRVNLPADTAASSETLRESESYFERLSAALDDVPARLDGLVTRVQAKQQKAASGVSFDVAALEPEPGPEGELLSLLGDADSAARSGAGPEGVSFGIGEPVSEAWAAAKAQFEALLEQVDREVLHFAWVETKVAGLLVARTSVDWTGDATTVWTDGISDEQMSLHHRTLNVAAQTRNIKMRLFFTVAGGATKMAALMATPGGVVLALPAVYQYVKQIVAQVKQLQSIQSS
jgi:hypothetical protein